MRVIAGKFRGRKLNSPKTINTRPTLDRVKEPLFSILANKLQDSIVLDLFAGTGSLGIEAVSRGAKEVYLNDLDLAANKVIYSNVQLTNCQKYARITRKDYERCLMDLSYEGKVFDVIFLDPPYESGVERKCLEYISKQGLINNDSVIVLESDKKTEFDENITGLSIIDKRTYGRVILRLYKRGE